MAPRAELRNACFLSRRRLRSKRISSADTPGAAKPHSNSGFLGVPRTCRDGPAGRLYGALPSPEILAKRTRISCLVVQRSRAANEEVDHIPVSRQRRRQERALDVILGR